MPLRIILPLIGIPLPIIAEGKVGAWLWYEIASRLGDEQARIAGTTKASRPARDLQSGLFIGSLPSKPTHLAVVRSYSSFAYVPESFRAAYRCAMPKPPPPPDLKHCQSCSKVIGPHRGWFGPECQCGREPGDALRGGHGRGTGS
jgi:hypothetical protein